MTDLISREAAIALLEAMYRASPWNVGLAEAVDVVTNMPSAGWSAGWFPLSVDDAETEMLFCLENMFGNPTDDKALLAQMRERGLWVFARNGWSPEE